MTRRIRRLQLACALLAVPMMVSAQAQLSFESLPASIVVDNAIFSEAETLLPFTVAHEGDATSWFVTVSRGNSGSFDPRQLQRRLFFFFTLSTNYNIFTPSEVIARDLSGPLTASSVASGTFAATASLQTASSQFSVRLPAEQFVRQGTYTDAVDLTLYRGSPSAPGTAVQVERRTVQITSVTSTVAQIGLVETGGAGGAGSPDFSFDFGPLSPGLSRSVDLVFRANSSYLVQVSSANGGRLRNINRTGEITIPYTFRYNGSAYNLSSRSTIGLSLLSGTGIDYARGTVEVQIGAFSNAPSGLYEDVVTFTISTF